jgi:hypothetical protein
MPATHGATNDGDAVRTTSHRQFAHGYALLIGVGEGAYAPWSLPVAVRDMQALQSVLTDPGLCGSPADHIRLLHDADATRQVILDGLAWLAGQAVADGDATAVVYFSGHGWLDEAGVGARRCALATPGLCRGCATQRCL